MLRRLALSSSSFKTASRPLALNSARALASTSASPLAAASFAEQTEKRHQAGFLAAAGLLAGITLWSSHQEKTKCCGIAGVVGTPNYDAR